MLLFLVLLAFVLALSIGTVSVDYTVVMELRLPRATNAFVVGAMLALAGALMPVSYTHLTLPTILLV